MKENSIKRNTLTVFLFISSLMILGFYYFHMASKDSLKNYKNFIGINKKSNRLLFLIDDCEKNINKYFKGHNITNYEKYIESSHEIDNVLDELENFSNNEKEVLTYLNKSDNTKHYQEILYYSRMIRNMNKYQRTMVEEINEENTGNLDTSIQIRYLNNYFNEMNSNTKIFIQAYFNFTGIIFDSYYEKNEKMGTDISIVISIVSFIGFVFIARYLRNFMKVLKQFERISKDLSLRNWDTEDLKIGKYRELNRVSEVINNMKHDIVNYIKEIENKNKLEQQLNSEKLIRIEKEKLLNETKLLSLQMKMNPHFLFNTLNLIGSTAITCDAELATDLIEAISEILRYNLEYDERKVDLDTEVDMLKKYIFIQNTRWQDRIDFKILNNVEEQNIKIPPMLIQPLIENSIIHGMDGILTKGLIEILFYEEKNYIVVSVSDNGCGIEKEKLKNLFEEEKKIDNKKRTSIGLKNIKKRMEMLYNRIDLFEVESNEKGTKISLYFPREGEKND